MAWFLISLMIMGTSTMEIVDLDVADNSVAIENAQQEVQTSTFLGNKGWGSRIPWWPISFCSWDFWTTAVWQITLAGKSVTCNSPVARATGTTLAGLGSRTIASNARVQNMLKGVAWNPLSTTPVLCAKKGAQLIYTVRLQVPASAMDQLRSIGGTQLMRSVYSAPSIRTLKLSGEDGYLFVLYSCWMQMMSQLNPKIQLQHEMKAHTIFELCVQVKDP